VESAVVGLTNDSGYRESRGIGVEAGHQRRIEVTEDRGCGKQGLEAIECGLGFAGPDKSPILLEDLGDGHDDTGISLYESPIEVCEAKEHLDVADRLGDRPLGDGSDARWLHGNTFRCDDITQESDFLSVEIAFLEVDIQLVFLKTLKDLAYVLNMLFESV
jgi:hypothetical protein